MQGAFREPCEAHSAVGALQDILEDREKEQGTVEREHHAA